MILTVSGGLLKIVARTSEKSTMNSGSSSPLLNFTQVKEIGCSLLQYTQRKFMSQKIWEKLGLSFHEPKKHNGRFETTMQVPDCFSRRALKSNDSGLSQQIPKDRIIFSKSEKVFYTDDYGKTKIEIFNGGTEFQLAENILMAWTNKDINNESHIYAGNINNLSSQQLKPMVLQSRVYIGYSHLDHSLLGSSQGQVFLHVSQDSIVDGETYGDLYVPDSTGENFTLLIMNNTRYYGDCDFLKVAGLKGIFLAKIYDHPQGLGKSKEFPPISFELPPYQRMIATFNNGQTWQSLKIDSSCREGENCSLQLHTHPYRSFVQLYNSEKSPGLLIGVGNVGKYLSMDINELNTYLSRDGGSTWHEVWFFLLVTFSIESSSLGAERITYVCSW